MERVYGSSPALGDRHSSGEAFSRGEEATGGFRAAAVHRPASRGCERVTGVQVFLEAGAGGVGGKVPQSTCVLLGAGPEMTLSQMLCKHTSPFSSQLARQIYIILLIGEEIEAWRSLVTCPRPHIT